MRVLILAAILSLLAFATGEAQLRVVAHVNVGIRLPAVGAHVVVGAPVHVRYVRHRVHYRRYSTVVRYDHGRGIRRGQVKRRHDRRQVRRIYRR